MNLDAARERVTDERGGILVLFTLVLPLAIVMCVFVIDVANWFEHRRHLQMQADAAALAGAQRFTYPCLNDPIMDEAHKYAGIGGSTYNFQIGGTPPERLHMLVNSRTWYSQASPTDDTVIEGTPCETGMVDVKLTETDLPWFFQIGDTDFINAHARAQLMKLESVGGALPIGVPETNPKNAKVVFVDEDTGTVLGEAGMAKVGTSGGFSVWDNSASPVPISVPAGVKNIGVRIVTSGQNSLECGEPLVSCFDAGDPNKGLVHIRGWSSEDPAGDAPQLGHAGLLPGTCGDAYFSYPSGTCQIGVSADVDFGDDPENVGAEVTAVVGNKTYPLTWTPDATDPTTGTWVSAGGNLIPVPAQNGPLPIELKWEQKTGSRGATDCTNDNANPCKGSFGTVQRTFTGVFERSGSIRSVTVKRAGVPLGEHSLERCKTGEDPATCTHNLVVEVGFPPPLEICTAVDCPIIDLRVTGGSQNQSLDCDPDQPKLKDEIANSCGRTYTVNQGTACPTSVNALWSTAEPWQCVAVQTGGAVGQVSAGMNLRVLGDEKAKTCTAPNHWTDQFGTWDPGDPRIIQVFLTPDGTFQGSGNTTVPVQGFATFYVTGWTSVGGFSNPCLGNGDEILGQGESGYIYGRFIKYVQTLDSGAGSEPCDITGFEACTAVLVE